MLKRLRVHFGYLAAQILIWISREAVVALTEMTPLMPNTHCWPTTWTYGSMSITPKMTMIMMMTSMTTMFCLPSIIGKWPKAPTITTQKFDTVKWNVCFFSGPLSWVHHQLQQSNAYSFYILLYSIRGWSIHLEIIKLSRLTPVFLRLHCWLMTI